MNIDLYDIVFLATLNAGITFVLLLIFVRRTKSFANAYLALALITTILDLSWYIPTWRHLPLHYGLATGPFLYLYVGKLTQPHYRIRWKDGLHFTPVLLDSYLSLSPAAIFVRQLTQLISITVYCYLSYRAIGSFYSKKNFSGGDRYRNELHWLEKLMSGFILIMLFRAGYLVMPSAFILYLASAITIIYIGAAAFLRTESQMLTSIAVPILPIRIGLREKASWLKQVMKAERYYQDPELSLPSLAEKLGFNPHELSQILNSVIKKSFSDFVNEFRVAEVIRCMQQPAYDHLTLLGIAFDAGFNSRTSFHRIFKQVTGISPSVYKAGLKKEIPTYNMEHESRTAPLILRHSTAPKWVPEKLNRSIMIKNYIKIAWRSLLKSKMTSVINISGLSLGMAVSLVIGLWIWSEISFDRAIPNFDRIALVMQNHTTNHVTETWNTQAYPMGQALRTNYGSNFKHVVMASGTWPHVLSVKENNIKQRGNFMEPGITDMLSLHMIAGDRNGLAEPSSILLSRSTAVALFGSGSAVNKTLTIDHILPVKITGVYEDLPQNSSFADLQFIAPWALMVASQHLDTRFTNPWGSSMFQTYVQIADQANMENVSRSIKDVKLNAIRNNNTPDARSNPVIFLQPLAGWHLYAEFKNGINTGGRIQYVRLFGITGLLVLLLACMNFMNLSTARSEKRAREVGIRKAIGSGRMQLVVQFYTESMLTASAAFVLSIVLVLFSLPYFNELAGGRLIFPWANPYFWLAGLSFTVLTGLLAGSYPAIYLSAFEAVKVLKGTFSTGKAAFLQRKALVVVQFTISVILVIGTIAVFKQVQFAKDRPVGYNRDGLVTVPLQTDAIYRQYAAIKNELINFGVVSAVALAETPLTQSYITQSGLDWKGKNPNLQEEFTSVAISPGFGATVGWKVSKGRDMSSSYLSDSSAMVINETAAGYMGLKDPVGKTVRWKGNGTYTIIGVVESMVTGSPYELPKPMFFYMRRTPLSNMILRIDPHSSTHQALKKIAAIFKQYDPASPFEYSFVNDDFARNFENENLIGKLAGCFAFMAMLISCLGLWGMATFMAEQRKKEIGVRKVLGASVLGLWVMLSKDFVRLVLIALLIAMPLAYLLMYRWLQHYNYRAGLSGGIFLAVAGGTLLIGVLTVSYQTVRAALANPSRSLKAD